MGLAGFCHLTTKKNLCSFLICETITGYLNK